MEDELGLFSAPKPELAAELRRLANDLKESGVYIGTSSWKYPGWCGQLYSEDRYSYRGKFAKSRFEANCLEEYSETFSTVCADSGFYRFPTPQQVAKLAAQTPDGFRMSWKVTDEITAKRFAKLPRHGSRSGEVNTNFLNAPLFIDEFLGPLSERKEKAGAIIFEFGQLYPSDSQTS